MSLADYYRSLHDYYNARAKLRNANLAAMNERDRTIAAVKSERASWPSYIWIDAPHTGGGKSRDMNPKFEYPPEHQDPNRPMIRIAVYRQR